MFLQPRVTPSPRGVPAAGHLSQSPALLLGITPVIDRQHTPPLPRLAQPALITPRESEPTVSAPYSHPKAVHLVNGVSGGKKTISLIRKLQGMEISFLPLELLNPCSQLALIPHLDTALRRNKGWKKCLSTPEYTSLICRRISTHIPSASSNGSSITPRHLTLVLMNSELPGDNSETLKHRACPFQTLSCTEHPSFSSQLHLEGGRCPMRNKQSLLGAYLLRN